jgi:hypothetical protein
MTKDEFFRSNERIMKEAIQLREKIMSLTALRDYRKEFYKHADAIIHETRMNYESMTGGFWYDPANVASRKVTGG